jgi:hypothetical protein
VSLRQSLASRFLDHLPSTPCFSSPARAAKAGLAFLAVAGRCEHMLALDGGCCI